MILQDIVTIIKTVDSSEIYIGTMPEKPDCVCAVYLSGGSPSIRTLDGIAVKRFNINVAVRDLSAENAILRADVIANLFDGYSEGNIIGISTNGFVGEGRDALGRSLLSANFEVQQKGE